MRTFILIALFTITTTASTVFAKSETVPISVAPKGAKAYIVSPENGATVSSPVNVVFGLKKMGIAPAGVQYTHSGHHHLIIDAPLPPPGSPIPNDKKHIHFGSGQTETMVDLPKGKHTLQLILGDHLHRPHKPSVHSKKIEIIVQ